MNISDWNLQYIGCAIALFLLCLYLHRRWPGYQHSMPLPPGPSPLPLIGNVHQLPKHYLYTAFMKWANDYGGIFYLRIFQKKVIVLSSAQAVRDLLDGRSMRYSDRPQFILVQNLLGWSDSVPFLPYGEQWLMHRKWYQTAFMNKQALDGYRQPQRREVNILLRRLFEKPDEFLAHIKRFFASLVMEIAYGHTATSSDDEFIQLADLAMSATAELSNSAAALVDFIPSLRHIPTWMPGSHFKRKALKVQCLIRDMYEIPAKNVQREMALGRVRPSFLSTLLEQINATEDDASEYMTNNAKAAAAILYGAVTDTTSTTIANFIIAMLFYPEVLKKAQAEMDLVVGAGRLPNFEDRNSLPFLECVLQEVYRWLPVVPLGVPHQTTDDDEYRGYFIPRGTMIIANIQSISRDPVLFPDPEVFRPERYQEMDEATAQLANPRWMTFGFGRRICPGNKLGDSSVWLVIANIIAAFDIREAHNAIGQAITPSISFRSGLVSHPEPFQCDIRPRSARIAEMLASL
ncbi:cytochrome P450 [Wolfiporia cocos MD-104 SS10]|uniref:Cytochrome P450 n=1 Tax=Wolfiporia cocos (strain MD-104) TaxID=742152 RepID=A0A2H3JEH8_WOLCO|nr:cytochrome P450 [Wolfiporia cocos MD-104 SS10]